MGVTWSSPSSRSASGSHPARAVVAGFRRLATLGLAAPSSVGRRQVELSEWRGVLETLRTLPGVLPVSRTPRFSRDGTRSLAGAVPSRLIDRSDPRPAAAQARVAAHKAARSLP